MRSHESSAIRGFLGYYSLADNFTSTAASVLWLTSASFYRMLASKRKSTLYQVKKSLKRAPGRYSIMAQTRHGETREYEQVTSNKQLWREKAPLPHADLLPNTMLYRSRMVLCERCHDDLHAGRLGERTAKRKLESRMR